MPKGVGIRQDKSGLFEREKNWVARRTRGRSLEMNREKRNRQKDRSRSSKEEESQTSGLAGEEEEN